MKRVVVATFLGAAVSANLFGAGQILFSTYISSAVVVPVTWSPETGHTYGSLVTGSDGITAELYYGLGSGLTFYQLTCVPGSATTVGTLLPGAITSGVVTLPNFESGPVTFAISVFSVNGSYASLSYLSTWTEPSGVVVPMGDPPNQFTPSLLAAAYPGGTGAVPIGIQLGPYPEPGVLALLSLGVATLMAVLRSRESSYPASPDRTSSTSHRS